MKLLTLPSLVEDEQTKLSKYYLIDGQISAQKKDSVEC